MEKQILELTKNSDLSISNIAKKLKISREEVVHCLIENEYYELLDNPNTKLPTVKKLKEASLYFIENNELGYSKIVRMFKLSSTRFKHYFEKWYPDYKLVSTKYKDSVFDIIDTEEKAYWLGFLYADGYISSNPLNGGTTYTFELTLAEKDKDHLEKFAKFVKYKNKISIRTSKLNDKAYNNVRLRMNSKHFWETLNNYGCTPRKSLTLEFPDESIFKSKDLIRHFIRGYFDGDGSLGIYDTSTSCNNIKYTYHNKRAQCSLLGTFEFLSSIQNYFYKYSNIDKEVKHDGSTAHPSNAYKIIYTCSHAFEFINWIYFNSTIYLNRKYEKYKEFCRLYEKSYRGLEGKNGELCDENTVLNSEIAKGSESV